VKPYVVYHYPCFDGFTAAWAARKQFGADGAEYMPQTHGKGHGPNADDWNPGFEPGRPIYFVDYAPVGGKLLQRLLVNNPVTILDHHKSSWEALGSPVWGDTWEREYRATYYFDMERSGAGITWDFFHGKDNRPLLVDLIEDRDLWRFKLQDSRTYSAFFGLFPWTFDAWDEMDETLVNKPNVALDFGAAALQRDKRVMEDLLEGGTQCCVYIGGWRVPAVNCPKQYGSDVAHQLLAKYPDAKFAAYYWDRSDGRREWGLRSRGDFDVSEVARLYDGGGHKAAAGFTASYTDDLNLEARKKGTKFE
jgi:uncharacterized protein